MRPWLQAKMGRDRLTDVCQRLAPTDWPGSDVWAEGKNWHVLAGVVRPTKRRVVAMVGTDDSKVAWDHTTFEFRYALVEFLQRSGITGHVAPVTIEAIEVCPSGEGALAA
jgi:hypothetical protein